jgi:hypothetical protein
VAGGTVELLREPKQKKLRPPKRGPGSRPAPAADEPEGEATDSDSTEE